MENDTKQILSKIYQELMAEVMKNKDNVFLKEYTIQSTNYNSDNRNQDGICSASDIKMELYQMMKQFDYKVFFSSYKDNYFFSNNAKKAEAKMLEAIESETKKESIEKHKLKRELEEKISKELKDFKENLMQCEPKTIMDRAYELVTKEEMTYKITEKNYSISEFKTLLGTDGILDECYDEWLDSDSNFNEVLEYAVDSRIELILEDNEENNKGKIEESR